MSAATSIEWTDATWNPVRGCTRVSEGCRNCYAETFAARFSGHARPFDGFARRVGGKAVWTGRVELIPEKLDQPLRWKKGRRIFVNSMSDLFHERLSDEAIRQVLAFAVAASWLRGHTMQILTKRAARMAQLVTASFWQGIAKEAAFIAATEVPAGEWNGGETSTAWPPWRGGRSEFAFRQWFGPGCVPPGIWLGVSAENQETADDRIHHLLATPAAVRFCSYEPALGEIDFSRIPHRLPDGAMVPIGSGHGINIDSLRGYNDNGTHTRIDWLIFGGESGPGARPCDIAWARSARDQCKAAGVAFFMKQLGAVPLHRCGQCGGSIGRVQGGWVDACGPTHAVLIAESERIRNRKGGDPSEWPEDLRVREFPGGASLPAHATDEAPEEAR